MCFNYCKHLYTGCGSSQRSDTNGVAPYPCSTTTWTDQDTPGTRLPLRCRQPLPYFLWPSMLLTAKKYNTHNNAPLGPILCNQIVRKIEWARTDHSVVAIVGPRSVQTKYNIVFFGAVSPRRTLSSIHKMTRLVKLIGSRNAKALAWPCAYLCIPWDNNSYIVLASSDPSLPLPGGHRTSLPLVEVRPPPPPQEA